MTTNVPDVTKTGQSRFVIHDDASTLVSALAEKIFEMSEKAIQERGVFTISLSGGSTPKALYQCLATEYKQKLQWTKIQFFLGDERCVSHEDKESNFKMISQAMFDQVPVPKVNVFPTDGQDRDPELAAFNYQKTMTGAFHLKSDEIPVFDFVLLGLGPDGHTASLFPGSKALGEKTQIFVANWVEKFSSYRLTSTYPLLNAARYVVFLVSGEGKAEILKSLFETTGGQYPAQNVQPTSGHVEWFVDKPAVALVNSSLKTS